MREFSDELSGRIPEEKVKVQLRQEKTARIMQQAGSVSVEGLGQKKTDMDARLYFRLLHQNRAKYATDEWLDDFLADNPELCAPGYRPKRNPYRHAGKFMRKGPL